MKKEKKFLKPEAEVIEFSINDIIVTSGDDVPAEPGDMGKGSYPWY